MMRLLLARRARALGLAGVLAAACGPSSGSPPDTGLDGLGLTSVGPPVIVPGSRLVLGGVSFVSTDLGTTRLRLRGSFEGQEVDLTLPAEFVDFDRMDVAWPGGLEAGLPGAAGSFAGEALVEVDSRVDGETHASPPLNLQLDVRAELEPRLDGVAPASAVIFVNEAVTVQGEGLLLGGDEGRTFAVVEGSFQASAGGAWTPVGPTEVPVAPTTAFDRTEGVFAFDPRIAGIHPGTFQGTILLRNRHGAGDAPGPVLDSAPGSSDYELVRPAIYDVSPPSASLGQYVDISGGGFVGAPSDSPDAASLYTTIELIGTFTAEAGGSPASVDLALVPQFVSGRLVRYVVSEDDDLGSVGGEGWLRRGAGQFVGDIQPIVHADGETERGDATPATLRIAHIKQVVYIAFQPGYVESLRHFGLRAVDDRIRRRIFQVAARDYEGVNVEFRDESPDDWALFEIVEISGPDPNALGLLGYDNTHGKDVGNARLYDRLGGGNALTQQDGFAGFGGVFVESFFGFSEHPGRLAKRLDGADRLFDLIFDPFRPDRGGHPVVAADLGDSVPELADGTTCPAEANNRTHRIACAIFVLGSMIGTTMTHEIGHSLGLANPYGDGFHNPGDQPDRLMDAGGARTFKERSELGEGPARFCQDEYDYLRDILPGQPDNGILRPTCF